MGEILAIAEERPAKKERVRRVSTKVEIPKSKYLFTGTDERGKKSYFFKIQVTGLHDRIFGPYVTRSKAVECFDDVLEAALDSFCAAQNSGGMEHLPLPEDLTPVPMR